MIHKQVHEQHRRCGVTVRALLVAIVFFFFPFFLQVQSFHIRHLHYYQVRASSSCDVSLAAVRTIASQRTKTLTSLVEWAETAQIK